ncbi:MAG: hypothetical protein WCJ86_00305 [Candidatus Saccharibacteria bacterium]|jgi:hypothetical protein
MKRKDILIIVVIATISGILSLVLSNLFITAPKNRQEKVEVVELISPEFKRPDSRYFNADSINPTKIIRIGDNTNPQPFGGTN